MSHLFSRLYERTLQWARHRHAVWLLGLLSFSESSFFPVPPDVMLAPMVLARPTRWLQLAGITTLASVAGGVLGYLIGVFALELVEPLILELGYWGSYETAREWFVRWGFWVVLLAGFSPIPYKIFTIAAGAMALALVPFVLASAVGRGARFVLVALLVAWGGPRVEPWLHTYIDRIGWMSVAVAVVAVALLQL
ncbi:YqaA family protein [Arhodomonas sp. SL1]|uniref:YqaA family protein n=1 Tax=Arhodomonas sp. SL1 TaxID=3425691 RepID=UPI003F88455D